MLKPIGYYILVEPIIIRSSDELIGLVVGAGESVNKDRVKIGDYIKYNPNYAVHISYKDKPFDTLQDDYGFEVVGSLKDYLNCKACDSPI